MLNSVSLRLKVLTKSLILHLTIALSLLLHRSISVLLLQVRVNVLWLSFTLEAMHKVVQLIPGPSFLPQSEWRNNWYSNKSIILLEGLRKITAKEATDDYHKFPGMTYSRSNKVAESEWLLIFPISDMWLVLSAEIITQATRIMLEHKQPVIARSEFIASRQRRVIEHNGR